MTTSILSDRSHQPAYQAAQLPSFEVNIPENRPEVTELDTSNSLTAKDANDKELEEARRTVAGLSTDHPDRLPRYRNLASLLSKRFEKTRQHALLAECIDLQRQICAVCPSGSPDKAVFVCDLALSLRTRFNQTGEESLLAEAIDLNREALSLRPTGHPDRSMSCNNLAYALWVRFTQMGDESILAEAIGLHREALSLRHSGHPERSMSCNNLAISLKTCFDQTGDESLLAEATDLHREALSLRPRGHPDRSNSCHNLAVSIQARFNQTGEESLLAEAIDLKREALSLRPAGHPHRSQSCNNLANSLMTRFEQTGEASVFTEAIDLQREALSLTAGGHLDRSLSCDNLAQSLWICFNKTGEESLLTEAIELLREALSLRPHGHPCRFGSCTNLALSLYARYKQAREESLLIEAIHLLREALSLQNSAHPLRLETCNRLVDALRIHFELTGDESMLVEAIDLTKETMKTQPQHHPRRWHAIVNLIHIYLNRHFSQHDPVLAIDYMQQALSLVSNDWPTLLSEVAQLTSLIDLPTIPQESLSQLLQCFSAAINLAFRVADFVLDAGSQLHYLNSSQHLGPRAYWCAIACKQPQLGLELMERSRAMMWTQSLHMKSPQLAGAPINLASELELLLHSMHISRTSPRLSSIEQDVQHKHGVRIHQLIQQIRTMPGHEGFMHGLPFKELAECASRNAVAVLVATEGECHALILRPGDQEPVTLKLSHIAPSELITMSAVVSVAQKRGSAPDGIHDDDRGMKASRAPCQTISDKTRSDPVLAKLWKTIVKPVIDQLQFQVRTTDGILSIIWGITEISHREPQDHRGHAFIGVRPVPSCFFLFMLPANMIPATRNAARTI
jgi:tetratricopeptide (TPR) repeat protein